MLFVAGTKVVFFKCHHIPKTGEKLRSQKLSLFSQKETYKRNKYCNPKTNDPFDETSDLPVDINIQGADIFSMFCFCITYFDIQPRNFLL
jgi:hypothetical protein